MSYILDAIKKAEKQRQSERVPTLEAALTKDSRKSARSKTWFWAGLLLSTLVAVGFLYRQELESQVRAASQATGQFLLNMRSVPAPSAREVEENSESQTLPEPDQSPGQSELTEPETASAEPGPAAESASGNTGALPASVQVSISVISYSRNEDKRFVMSGVEVLREGDRLNGHVIQEIRKGSVVIEVEGALYEVRP